MTIKYIHTNIISDDWERLVGFYREVFDCEPVPPERDLSDERLDKATNIQNAHLRGIHLRLPGWGDDGPTLEIFQYDKMEERQPAAANRKGLCHIAFRVDDVASAWRKVLEHGGKNLGEIAEVDVPGVGKVTFAYMTDPEGNIIEIQGL